jgi:hypothetical protein
VGPDVGATVAEDVLSATGAARGGHVATKGAAVRNWNSILRWVHLLSGLLISAYFLFMPDDGWSDGVNNAMQFGVVSFVAWTGIIKWQLPRIRRWSRRRSAGRAEAAV